MILEWFLTSLNIDITPLNQTNHNLFSKYEITVHFKGNILPQPILFTSQVDLFLITTQKIMESRVFWHCNISPFSMTNDYTETSNKYNTSMILEWFIMGLDINVTTYNQKNHNFISKFWNHRKSQSQDSLPTHLLHILSLPISNNYSRNVESRVFLAL